MNMRTRPVTRRTTTTPRTTTVSRTTLQELATTTSRPDLRERIAEEGNLISRNIFSSKNNFLYFSTLVLEMDEHGLADAFRDPMMMGLGAMVIAAGAYMAIVMQV